MYIGPGLEATSEKWPQAKVRSKENGQTATESVGQMPRSQNPGLPMMEW